jgi:hypothetical protein
LWENKLRNNTIQFADKCCRKSSCYYFFQLFSCDYYVFAVRPVCRGSNSPSVGVRSQIKSAIIHYHKVSHLLRSTVYFSDQKDGWMGRCLPSGRDRTFYWLSGNGSECPTIWIFQPLQGLRIDANIPIWVTVNLYELQG